jgi:hypothetical protein
MLSKNQTVNNYLICKTKNVYIIVGFDLIYCERANAYTIFRTTGTGRLDPGQRGHCNEKRPKASTTAKERDTMGRERRHDAGNQYEYGQ